MDKYLISRLNVANSEFCENGVTRKIPHGDFEKLAGMGTGCPKKYVTLFIIYNFIKPKVIIAKIFSRHFVYQYKFYLPDFGKIL
jgi:hypothetical protein